jgi:hypothetical protein
MFDCPMSSPQMMTMLGFLAEACAQAEAGPKTRAAKATIARDNQRYVRHIFITLHAPTTDTHTGRSPDSREVWWVRGWRPLMNINATSPFTPLQEIADLAPTPDATVLSDAPPTCA